jgi:hypothetical protein
MAEVVELDKDYGYKSRTAQSDVDEEITVNDLPVVKIEEWLSPEAEIVTKWVKLPSRKAKILIKAMTNTEFKKMRNDAPNIKRTLSSGKIKIEKDEDWIQTRLIMENVIEPKITDPSILEYGLAGDVSFLVVEISKLSGFDVDKAIRDALE